MNDKKKFPYGISNFRRMKEENFLYVDKTKYIEVMEEDDVYMIMLRPRRFGKSLWISTLSYYYDVKYKDEFEKIFGGFYIGKNPTKRRNSYLILNFDFSGINTKSKEETFSGFRASVLSSINEFYAKYDDILSKSELDEIKGYENPPDMLKIFFSFIKNKIKHKLYILIDEYDQFTNEVLAFNPEYFDEIVSKGGYVRKFYEQLKEGTKTIIDRMFITGVTPLTLDSISSGFNIAKHKTNSFLYRKLFGFTEEEVRKLIKEGLNHCSVDEDEIVEILKQNYDGYIFNEEQESRVYNPEMVLYFLSEYEERCRAPKDLIDPNIGTDVWKFKKFLRIKNPDRNFEIIKEIVESGSIYGRLMDRFISLKGFSEDHFISFLYYLGVLTFRQDIGGLIFEPPNYVIKEVFWDVMREELTVRANYELNIRGIKEGIMKMAKYGDIKGIVLILEEFLDKILSNRDFIKLDEKHIKLSLIMLVNMGKVYFIKSEYEDERGYIDIVFKRRPGVLVNYEHAVEIKYLKSSASDGEVEAKLKEGIEQMKKYLKTDEAKSMQDLKAHVLVFKGTKALKVQEI